MIQEKSESEAVKGAQLTQAQFKFEADEKWSQTRIVNDRSFIAAIYQSGSYSIRHIGFDGKIMAELDYQMSNLHDFIVMSEETVIFLNGEMLILWELSKNEFKETPIKFHFQQTPYPNVKLFYFDESQLISCAQRKDHKLKLTYFKLSEISSGVPFCQFVDENFSQGPRPDLLMKRLNQRSMIGLVPQIFFFDMENSNFLRYFEVDFLKQSVCYKKIEFEMDAVLNPNKYCFLRGRISDVWEAEPNLLYVQIQTFINVCEYERSDVKQLDENKEERYHTFYYDTQQNIAKVGKVNIAAAHRLQFINSIRSVRQTQEEKWSLRQRIKQNRLCRDWPRQPQPINVPIYYIEPDGERIELVHKKQLGWNEYYEWPQYRTDKMFKIFYEPMRRTERTVTVYQHPQHWFFFSCGLKLLSVFWVSYLLADCCDDLLELVHGLL